MATAEPYREAIDFLSNDPKNLELAFDLIEAFPALLDRFHAKFWDTLKDTVERELNNLSAPDWSVSFYDSENSSDFLEPGSKSNENSHQLMIAPTNWEAMQTKFRFCAFWLEQNFEKDASTAELCYGYGFNKGIDQAKQAKLSKSTGLPIREQQVKEWISYSRQLERDGWLARKQLPYALRGRDETILLAKGDSLETEIADALIELFKQKQQAAEKINAALRQH
jgi:hypothetical protein